MSPSHFHSLQQTLSHSLSPPAASRPPPPILPQGPASAAAAAAAAPHPQPQPLHPSPAYSLSQPSSQSASRLGSPGPLSDSFLQETIAQQTSITPPRSFLANILNPSEPLPSGDRIRYDWQPESLYRRTLTSPDRETYSFFDDFNRLSRMPPVTRSHGYIDLTNEHSSPPPERQLRRLSKRSTALRPSAEPHAGPSRKRMKREDGTSTGNATPQFDTKGIEEIDLSDDKIPLNDALQKKQAKPAKAEDKPEEKPVKLSNLTCVICMDTPTDLTATACGHLFCHSCLMEALIAGENRNQPGEAKRSQCPICRKFINRTKAPDIIPLLMKKGPARKRKRYVIEDSDDEDEVEPVVGQAERKEQSGVGVPPAHDFIVNPVDEVIVISDDEEDVGVAPAREAPVGLAPAREADTAANIEVPLNRVIYPPLGKPVVLEYWMEGTRHPGRPPNFKIYSVEEREDDILLVMYEDDN